MKVERGADTFYNQVIDEFAERNKELNWFTNRFL